MAFLLLTDFFRESRTHLLSSTDLCSSQNWIRFASSHPFILNCFILNPLWLCLFTLLTIIIKLLFIRTRRWGVIFYQESVAGYVKIITNNNYPCIKNDTVIDANIKSSFVSRLWNTIRKEVAVLISLQFLMIYRRIFPLHINHENQTQAIVLHCHSWNIKLVENMINYCA